MSAPLWTKADFVAATGGEPRGDIPEAITGVSIDSRTISEGEAYVAIVGDRLDGHDFADAALEAGASCALVARDKLEELPENGRYVIVDDPLEALRQLGIAARARSQARIVAVTGSVGKTSTKEALRRALEKSGKVHASVKSFNNHWGVPLTLARMPADTEFGVFEIGMNHAGEITPLVGMVRPHVAVITTVAAVHLEFFGSVEKIAQAKSEIFSGLEPDGVAVLNMDNNQFDLLKFLAKAANVPKVVTFGRNQGADCHIDRVVMLADHSSIQGAIFGKEITYKIGVPGDHHVDNSMAVLSAVHELGADVELAGLALAEMEAPQGRGEIVTLPMDNGTATLVDESYNANPASMRAALKVLGELPISGEGRRIAVLGDMRELGKAADRLHAELAEPVTEAAVSAFYCCGPHMKALNDALPDGLDKTHRDTAAELQEEILSALNAGDIIMIKGSLGTRMGPLVDALKKEYPPAAEAVAE